MPMAVEFLSLPTELICHILILLNPRDISRCAMTCNTFLVAVRNSVEIQYKLEIYAQGLISTETATTASVNSDSISRKMCSLKKLASLWQSDFYANTIFETMVTAAIPYIPIVPSPIQSVKCGPWWTDPFSKFCDRDYRMRPKLSLTWSINDPYQQHWLPDFITFDPVQDLIVMFSSPDGVTVTNAEQDHHVFSVEFVLGSSHCPHPNAARAALECKHTFNASGFYCAYLAAKPIICGDHVFVFYHTGAVVSGTFIQVINWRKGYANNHFLCQLGHNFHVVDEQRIVVTNAESSIYLYMLQGLDGPPQCRAIYHLPESLRPHNIYVRTHPSFHGKPAHPELAPSYVPSLESQIMVVDFFWERHNSILVISMAIFSDAALHSDMAIEIPWSDWGPQHTYYFPHDLSHHISVFGSKIAYALPQDRVLDPGQRLERISTWGYFYVHIWDFNKRVIARSESIDDPNSPDLHICKPGPMPDSFGEDIFSHNEYTATICHTPFPTCSKIFLEQDRLTLIWDNNDKIGIRVISPVQMEVDPHTE